MHEDQIQKLRDGDYWMLWSHQAGEDPFKYFLNKYGFPATEVVIGDGVELAVPKGVTVHRGGFQTTKGMVKLR